MAYATRVVDTQSVPISNIRFVQAHYPRNKPSSATVAQYVEALRAGAEFPPVDLDVDGSVLLDGYHRWKAHEEIGSATLSARLIDLQGMPRKLYAARMNGAHGDRLTSPEKREVAREMVKADQKQDDIAKELGVSQATISSWVSDLVQAKQRTRDAQIWWLHTLGWTQAEIGERVGLPQQKIAPRVHQLSELIKGVNEQSSRGRTPAEIAETEGVPVNLASVLLLDGKDDLDRMDALKCRPKPYDVWQFTGCDDRFGASYPGRIPGQLVIQMLYFFTRPGDTVIDPMAGSGTTLDACAYMGRKVYGFDVHPIDGRSDIVEHDVVADGWPGRTSKAHLVFLDPPYYKKKDDEYGDKSISRKPRDDYLASFSQMLSSLPPEFAGRIALICSDYNDEKNPDEDIFYPEYVSIFAEYGWRILRRVQVPLNTQQVHPDIHNRFVASRRLVRLGRDLVVFVR